MFREAVKGFLKPIIAEAMAEVQPQSGQSDTTRYYTPQEAWEHLKISRAAFYRLVGKGKIELLKIGGKSLVNADNLDGAIQRREIYRYKH